MRPWFIVGVLFLTMSGGSWAQAQNSKVKQPIDGGSLRVSSADQPTQDGGDSSDVHGPVPPADDELQLLYEQILKDPRNTELNLRYARLAEKRGDLRKALTAYERVTVDDPGNQEAAQGYIRVRRKLEPNTTRMSVELGAGYDTNPARVSTGVVAAPMATVLSDLRDDRAVGDFRLRTNALVNSELYANQNDLNYFSAGFMSGPVFDLSSKSALHVALGGTTSLFENAYYYSEATAAATYETAFWNATESLQLRAGARRYGPFFDSSSGYYVDATGRVVWSDAFVKGDVLVFSPRYRFSFITGLNLEFSPDPVQPGHYHEWNVREEYYRPILSWLTVGESLSLSGRTYAEDIDLVTGTPVRRQDLTITPGLSLVLPDILGKSDDVRFDYKFELNQSTIDIRNYTDHIVTATAVFRF